MSNKTIHIEATYSMYGTDVIEIPEHKEIEDVYIKWDTALIKYTDGSEEKFELELSYEDGDTKRPDNIRVFDEDYNLELYERSGW